MVLEEHNVKAATNLQSNQLPPTLDNPANNVKSNSLTIYLIRNKAHLPQRKITLIRQGIKRSPEFIDYFNGFDLSVTEVEINN